MDIPWLVYDHSQNVVWGPLGLPKTFSGDSQEQNYFHNNPKDIICVSYSRSLIVYSEIIKRLHDI